MVAYKWVVAPLAAVATGFLIAGCSAPLDCAYPYASVPATATAGESVTLEVTGLYPDCQAEAQRHDPSIVRGEVTVTLQRNTGDVEATATAPIESDATATAVLEIPATASGDYDVDIQGNVVGTVTVAPPTS